MAIAARDDNRVPTVLGALNTDGVTPIKITADPSSHGISTSDGNTGSDHGTTNASRDDNRVPVLMATSSADGTTPVEVYADSSGNLLIQST